MNHKLILHVTKWAHVMTPFDLRQAREDIAKGLLDDIQVFIEVKDYPEYRAMFLKNIELSLAAICATNRSTTKE